MSYKDHLPTETEMNRRQTKQFKALMHTTFVASPPAVTQSLTDNGLAIVPPTATQDLLNPLLEDVNNLVDNTLTTINVELDKIVAGLHRIQLPDVAAVTINFVNLVKNKALKFFLDLTKENPSNTPTVTFNPPLNGLAQTDIDANSRTSVLVVARDTEDEVRYDVIGNPGGGANQLPSSSEENQKLEWNNTSMKWEAKTNFEFGPTGPWGDAGFLRFPNNSLILAARNALDDGNIELKIDSSNKIDWTISDNTNVVWQLRAQHAVNPDVVFSITQNPDDGTGLYDTILEAPAGEFWIFRDGTPKVLINAGYASAFQGHIAMNNNRIDLVSDVVYEAFGTDGKAINWNAAGIDYLVENVVDSHRFFAGGTGPTDGKVDINDTGLQMLNTSPIYDVPRIEFIDNAATPSATVALYSDGTKLLSKSDLDMNIGSLLNVDLAQFVDTGGVVRGSISGDTGNSLIISNITGGKTIIQTLITPVAEFDTTRIDFYENLFMNTGAEAIKNASHIQFSGTVGLTKTTEAGIEYSNAFTRIAYNTPGTTSTHQFQINGELMGAITRIGANSGQWQSDYVTVDELIAITKVADWATYTNATPSDGQIWYDTTDLEFKFRENGATHTLGTTPDQIVEGDSRVEVVDAGTGTIDFYIDSSVTKKANVTASTWNYTLLDIDMFSNDINTVGRLEFGTISASLDSEAVINWDAINMRFHVPTGDGFVWEIGTVGTQYLGLGTSTLNFLNGLDIDLNDNYIQFDGKTVASVGTPPAGEVRLFCDSDNDNKLSVKDANADVYEVQGHRNGTLPRGTGIWLHAQQNQDMTTNTAANNDLIAIPWIPHEDCTVVELGMYVQTARVGTGGDVELGLYANSPTTSPGNYPVVKLTQTTSAITTSATGAKTQAVTAVSVKGGFLYWLVFSQQTATTTNPNCSAYDGAFMPVNNIGLTTSDFDNTVDFGWGWKVTSTYSTTMISSYPASATRMVFSDNAPAIFVHVTVP